MKILYNENRLSATATTDLATPPPITLLTDSSLSRNWQPLFLPPHARQWEMTFGLAFRMMRLGKYIAARFAPRYYDAMTIIARLRPAGLQLPATACLTAFDSAAVVGDWQPITPEININGTTSCRLAFDPELINNMIETLSRYFTIKTGDILVAGDLEAIIPATADSTISLSINNINCLNFKIK